MNYQIPNRVSFGVKYEILRAKRIIDLLYPRMIYDDLNQANVEALDCKFEIGEVILAIKSLKKGKSSGVDLLNPEIFIEGSDILAPILCRLFNYMFDNSVYPESWTKGPCGEKRKFKWCEQLSRYNFNQYI